MGPKWDLSMRPKWDLWMGPITGPIYNKEVLERSSEKNLSGVANAPSAPVPGKISKFRFRF